MKKIKWGIIGCGAIAHKFAQALQQTEGCILYAAAARNGERAANFARQWGFEKAVEGYKALASDPEVDIVYIATPHSYHYAHTLLCLESGKHVLCEKPFTVNAEQLRKLIELAQSKQLFMMEALWSKFLPGIIKTKELVDAGAIGEPVFLNVDFGIHFPFDAEHRLYNPLLAGGALLDLGIYPLYLSLYLFGKPSVMKAHAVLNENKIDITTSIIAQSKSGTMCNLNTTTQANTPVKASISGTSGSIEFDAWWFTPVDVTLRVDGKEDEILPFPAIVNGYEYEIMEVLSCLNEGKTESGIMPFSFSTMLLEQMDEIRRITGITYPDVIESVDHPFGWNEL